MTVNRISCFCSSKTLQKKKLQFVEFEHPVTFHRNTNAQGDKYVKTFDEPVTYANISSKPNMASWRHMRHLAHKLTSRESNLHQICRRGILRNRRSHTEHARDGHWANLWSLWLQQAELTNQLLHHCLPSWLRKVQAPLHGQLAPYKTPSPQTQIWHS